MANDRETLTLAKEKPQELPKYKLIGKFFGDNDVLYFEGDEITYTGTPNNSMYPINDAAREVLRIYYNGLEAMYHEACKKFGSLAKEHFTRPVAYDDFIESGLKADAPITAIGGDDGRIAIMKAKKTSKTIQSVTRSNMAQQRVGIA